MQVARANLLFVFSSNKSLSNITRHMDSNSEYTVYHSWSLHYQEIVHICCLQPPAWREAWYTFARNPDAIVISNLVLYSFAASLCCKSRKLQVLPDLRAAGFYVLVLIWLPRAGKGCFCIGFTSGACSPSCATSSAACATFCHASVRHGPHTPSYRVPDHNPAQGTQSFINLLLRSFVWPSLLPIQLE